jgi:hypothetical protein
MAGAVFIRFVTNRSPYSLRMHYLDHTG